ncbi:MAG: NMD3-related protein [Candidatus Micrarchaeia archaeon]
MEKICPKCGALSSKKKFIGEFCEDCCFKAINIPLPSKVELPFCKFCGKVKVKKWAELSRETLTEIVKRNAGKFCDSFHIQQLREGVYEVTFNIKRNSNYFQIKKQFSIQKINSVCDECYRKKSGYYEAIIQIRGERARNLSNKVIREIEKRTFVSRCVESKEGIDFYVGSKKAAAEALASLNLKPKISDKLFGVKDGRRVYRRTYCVIT